MGPVESRPQGRSFPIGCSAELKPTPSINACISFYSMRTRFHHLYLLYVSDILTNLLSFHWMFWSAWQRALGWWPQHGGEGWVSQDRPSIQSYTRSQGYRHTLETTQLNWQLLFHLIKTYVTLTFATNEHPSMALIYTQFRETIVL